MKKLIVSILWLCTLFILWNVTQARDYEYKNLDITANILKDWTINVLEDYTADFFVYKHGIIRDIPFNYTVNWKEFHIDINNINVQWKNFTLNNNGQGVSIKIGDANKTINWIQEYPISYTVYWLIRNFSWYDELYWNIVGHEFDTNINKVRAELILPEIYTWFTTDDFKITTDWELQRIEEFNWKLDFSEQWKIKIEYDKWLSAYHGITLAIRFKDGYFDFNHDKQKNLIWHVWVTLTSWYYNNETFLYLALTVVTFIIFMIICGFWSFFKKMKKIDLNEWKLHWELAKKYPVIVQYEPPKWLNSAEVGLLLHRDATFQDMLSLIYQRSTKWLIKISKKDKDTVTIKRVKDIDLSSPYYERLFFCNLFTDEDEIEIGKDSNIYRDIPLDELDKYWEEKMWYKRRYKENNVYLILWLLCFCVPSFIPIVILIIVLGVVKRYKVKIYDQWAELISHIVWYRQFLAACEENQLRTFLKEDPLYFDKVLPYAVVFWIQTELLEKIKPIMEELNITTELYDGDMASFASFESLIASSAFNPSSSYSSDSWFDSWSSFSSDSSFSSWWGGGWGWWSSW